MNEPERVIVAQMKARDRGAWSPVRKNITNRMNKRLLRTTSVLAAACLCLGAGAYLTARNPQETQSVMSRMTTSFEYDDSLGRLQFVSNVLPESAMVFLTGDDSLMREITKPTAVDASHPWSQDEPWIEYRCVGDVYACGAGEVMTVVRNREDEYTVRVLHENGYESLYSGLSAVQLDAQDTVEAGQQIGTSTGFAAFELRKDGLSVQPVFAGN